MEIAKIRVDGTFADVVERRAIPSGLVGGTIRVEYAPGIWDNLSKTVVFRGVTERDVLTQETVVEIPHETVAAPNKRLQVGFYGVNASGVQIIPTLWADLGLILPGADPSGDPSTDPSLPVWAQIQEELKNLNVSGGVQSDWNANEGEPGHILNRPFYSKISTVEILPETEIPFNEEDEGYLTEISTIPAGSSNVTVGWNGTSYVCKVYDFSLMLPGMVGFGNWYRAIGDDAAIIGAPLVDTGEPFVIQAAEIDGFRLAVATPLEEIQSLTLSLTEKAEVVHPIPEKYIPVGVDTFTVEVTKDSSTGDWTANKTPAEIFNAHKSGKEIFCKLIYGYATVVMLPVAVSEIGAAFSTVYLDVDAPSQDYVVNSEIAITKSGVTHRSTLLATRKYVQDQIASSGAGGNVELDTTLTKAGKAADAKAVGDAISKLSGGNVDLTGYATEEYVQEYAQPKGEYLTEVPSGYAQKSEIPTKVSQLQNDKGYLTEHQDISGKLDSSELPTAINTALSQAKASGEFDGAAGKTPVRGTDYWTAADIAEIKTYVDNAILGGAW